MKNRNYKERAQYMLPIVLIGSLLVFLLFASCSASAEGAVHIYLDRSIERSGEADPLHPDLNLEIASYELTLYGPEHTTLVMKRTLVSEQSETLFDTLPTGTWKLRVEAKNAEGTIIRSLVYNDDLGDRVLPFSVRRGEISLVDCTLAPYWEGKGSLFLSLDWSLVDVDLLASKPEVIVVLTPLGNGSSLDEVTVHVNAGDYQVLSQQASDHLSAHLSPTEGISPSRREVQLALRDLPAGLYEVSLRVQAQATTTKIWQGVRFVSMMEAATTELEVSLLDPALQTGSITLPIGEQMKSLDVSFSEASPKELSTNTEGRFTVSVSGLDSTYTLSYNWYVNGELVSEEQSPTFVHSFNEAGQYTITSSVTAKNSANTAVNWGMAQSELSVLEEEKQ